MPRGKTDHPTNYYTHSSLLRPLVVSGTYSIPKGNMTVNPPRWNTWYEEDFRSWIDGQFEHQVAFITNDAIARFGYQYLTYYPCIAVYGLHEYWASEWLLLIQQYVISGGNLFIAALEFGLGSIRLQDNGDTMVYYRNVLHDPSFTNSRGGATDRALTPDLDMHNLDRFFGSSFRLERIFQLELPLFYILRYSRGWREETCSRL
jgi:hypothetical protein